MWGFFGLYSYRAGPLLRLIMRNLHLTEYTIFIRQPAIACFAATELSRYLTYILPLCHYRKTWRFIPCMLKFLPGARITCFSIHSVPGHARKMIRMVHRYTIQLSFGCRDLKNPSRAVHHSIHSLPKKSQAGASLRLTVASSVDVRQDFPQQ